MKYLPATITAAALVDGRIAWVIAYPDKIEQGFVGPINPQADTFRFLISTFQSYLRPNTQSINVSGIWADAIAQKLSRLSQQPVSQTRNALTRHAEQALPSIDSLKSHWSRLVVPSGLDPRLVAVDASVRDGKAAWAYVTGAGWYSTGLLMDVDNSNIAEFAAIVETVNAFSTGSNLVLLTDNAYAHNAIEAVLRRPETHSTTLINPASFLRAQRIIRSRRIDVKLVPRNYRPFHTIAHNLCYAVTRDWTQPTMISEAYYRGSRFYGQSSK